MSGTPTFNSVAHRAVDARVTMTLASAADEKRWDDFVLTQSSGSFYHLYGWRTVVQSCFGHDTYYLMALEEGKVVGILPLVLLSSALFGRILCSVPFMNYGGPCADSGRIVALLVAEAITKANQLGVDYLELRCAEPLNTDLPVSVRKVSMTLGLDQDPEAVWNQFAPKHRKNIRRAYKNSLEVVSGGAELLSDFYLVLERSWRDLGTPLYRRAYFEAILNQFPTQTRIFLCTRGSRSVAVAFVGLHGTTAEGMWQGSLPSSRLMQANYVLYWEMIRYYCLNGCRKFHLGRSTADSGSEQFKQKWNAGSQQLFWYFHRPDGGPIPALNVDNPRYRLAIATWRRLPIPVVRRLGPRLARSIP